MARTVTEVTSSTLLLQTLLREAYIHCHCPHGAVAQHISTVTCKFISLLQELHRSL